MGGSLHYNKPFMALFRIHRMRPHVKQSFRWAPHVTGLAIVKPRDYLPGAEIEAPNEYALWAELKKSENPLEIGDLVESGSALKICKFVGFESAKWAETEAAPAPSCETVGVTESN
jgi:hypothetical protein